jgi:hypothetical protein
MATTKKPLPAKSMAVIQLGWQEYVLPVKDAAAIMAALESAERYDTKGYGDEKLHFIGGEAPNVGMKLLDESAYLQGKFAGPFSKAESSET